MDHRFDCLKDYFHFEILATSPKEKKLCLLYLYKKICQIVLKYPEYSDYKDFSPFDKKGNLLENHSELSNEQLKMLLKKISNGKSHIEIKAKRAIEFLNLDDEKIHILFKEKEFDDKTYLKFFYDDLSNVKLDDIITHLPPPFLEKNIILKNKNKNTLVDYRYLSSGEHQKYQNISTHLYHLTNLISVQRANEMNGENRLAYKYINLVFDEIEICYHPEYQRTFVNTLVQMLKVRGMNEKCMLNIFFVTHSPFILSDIPISRALFLNGGNQYFQKQNTFAANIGEMFYDFFFLKSTIGAFAEEKIKKAVEYRQRKNPDQEKELPEQDKSPKQKEYEAIIKSIGDPVIRSLIEEVEVEVEDEEVSSEEEAREDV